METDLPDRYWDVELQRWIYPPAAADLDLPPLPEPKGWRLRYSVAGLNGGPGLMTRPSELYQDGTEPSGDFTAEQMRAYALAERVAERERCARFVGVPADAEPRDYRGGEECLEVRRYLAAMIREGVKA